MNTQSVSYKEKLEQRLSDLQELKDSDLNEWAAKFISSVSVRVEESEEGVFCLSPKQIAKVEELWDRYCV